VVYWRGKHWDGPSGSSGISGINQGHADTVQGIGRTVPVHAVTEIERRIEGEVMEERNNMSSRKQVCLLKFQRRFGNSSLWTV